MHRNALEEKTEASGGSTQPYSHYTRAFNTSSRKSQQGTEDDESVFVLCSLHDNVGQTIASCGTICFCPAPPTLVYGVHQTAHSIPPSPNLTRRNATVTNVRRTVACPLTAHLANLAVHGTRHPVSQVHRSTQQLYVPLLHRSLPYKRRQRTAPTVQQNIGNDIGAGTDSSRPLTAA